MRVTYYTAGVTGSGHVVRGIALGLGLRRKDPSVEYTLLHPSRDFARLCDAAGFANEVVPSEDEGILSPAGFRDSLLYSALLRSRPDALVVDMYWFALDAMLDELVCRKVFLCRQVHPSFFRVRLPDRDLAFEPRRWDMLVSCEPWDEPFPMRRIDPLVLRNRDEILPRERALEALGASGRKPVFLLHLNARPGDFEAARKSWSYLADEGWDCAYSTNYEGGLFPAADCFAAVDLLACGAGYNSFWESTYLGMDARYMPAKARFEDAWERIRRGTGYRFAENGADTLARMLFDS